jgi:hypothetical protein
MLTGFLVSITGMVMLRATSVIIAVEIFMMESVRLRATSVNVVAGFFF